MLSIVIPLLNERESLAELHADILELARQHDLDLEMLFVDDGSTDGSWAELRRLQKTDSRIRGIRLRRNFGKSAALSAGLRAIRGDTVVTMDADLQDDPREIPHLLTELSKGADLVSGWKQVRHDPWHKVWPSRVFNWLIGILTGVRLHDHNCGLKVYRAEVVRDLRLYGELHRFIPVLAAAQGYRVAEVAVNHRPRKYGQSKFGVGRFTRGFLDLLTVKFLTSFGRRPQHLIGGVGLLAFVMGALSLGWLSITWMVNRFVPGWALPLHERALLWYAIAALLFGTQLLSIGFLAELMTAHQARDTDAYSIADEM